VTLVRRADRGDRTGVRARREPVEQLGPDRPATVPSRVVRLVRARPAGDDQEDPGADRAGLGEAGHQPLVGGAEAEAVEVDLGVGRNQAAGKAIVPAGVEGAV
jgi:hypothetical protein